MSGTDQSSATGHCLCGAVQFEAKGEPIWVLHCHCEHCRHNTGSAVATFISYPMNDVSWSGAARSFYESSPGVQRGFCVTCGTPMSYEGDRAPGETHLYISTMDSPQKFRPTKHVFFDEKIAWFDTADDLPRYPRSGSPGNKPLE